MFIDNLSHNALVSIHQTDVMSQDLQWISSVYASGLHLKNDLGTLLHFQDVSEDSFESSFRLCFVQVSIES